MKIISLIAISLIPISNVVCQFQGKYLGTIHGDPVVIEVTQVGNSVSGIMKDSQQSYSLTGSCINYVFEGKAIEAALGISFILMGQLSENAITLDGDIEMFGSRQDAFNGTFSKVSNESPNINVITNNSVITNLPPDVKSKPIDPRLIGTWKQESNYLSGYASDFYGSTNSYMSFNANHTMSDKGSQVIISGSNYSGNSGGQTTGKVIPNIWYYTEGNKIMIYTTENNLNQHLELGTYFIEDYKMLFTQANTGKKILYLRE